MSLEQLADWWLLYQHDPFGSQREDHRAWFASRGMWGAEGCLPEWPYMEPPVSADEIKEALGKT